MKFRLYLIILFASWLCLSAHAQDKDVRKFYDEAEEEYNMGRIEYARDLLNQNINNFSGSLRQSGYRLLALCHLAIDQPDKAEYYTSLLLNEDPYYTPSAQDPMRFADMVTSLKAGRTATITTASSQAENLNEVPVPTTLITEEMIHNCGGRNLQEVLAAYVPGMHIIDCNDDINIAMRGIYSNGQEKILFMLNGHSINSYCTNIAAPDFGISLEKLKQIEVLRGPASSLYGGMALTGVVNLITKQGADLDGIEVKGGIGNYGQLRGELVFGKRYFDLDLLVWGSIYKNKGEEREAPERDDIYDMGTPYVTIGRIGDKPSYNFGIQLKWKDLTFLYDNHFSQIVAPFTITTLASSYDRDKYKTFEGIGPSFATRSSHASLNYSHQLGKLNLSGTLTYDNSDMTRYQVFYDTFLGQLGKVFGLPSSLDSTFMDYCGTARFISGHEHTIGGKLRGDFSYINNSQHKGLITFGADFSHFNMGDMRYQLVYEFTHTTPENYIIENFSKDHENRIDAFAQMKHQWRSFILNVGLRYDYKSHYNHTKLREFSPRLALIFLQPKWNVKLSYSKAFVDAPYFYRKTNDILEIIEGEMVDEDEYLKPEFLHSWQLTFTGNQWVKGFDFEINGFYNSAKDQVSTLISQCVNGALNKTIGVELMAKYRHRLFTADFNFTWTKTLKAKLLPDQYILDVLIPSDINDNNNTPTIMSNAVLTWKPSQRLKFFSHICFEGKQDTYNIDVVNIVQANNFINIANDVIENDPDYASWYINTAYDLLQKAILHDEIDPRVTVNVGAEYKIGPVTLGANVHNLFNTHYFQSGMNTRLVPQKGRWLMATIAYKF